MMFDYAKEFEFVGMYVCVGPTSYDMFNDEGDEPTYKLDKEYYVYSDGEGGYFVKSVQDPHVVHRLDTEISLFFFQNELDTCFKPVTD